MKKQRLVDGYLEAFLTDKDGNKRMVYAGQNNFYIDFNKALAKHLDNNYDIDLNAGTEGLFSANGTPAQYGNGMAGLMDGLFQSFVSTLSQPSAEKLRVTGVYTNSSGSSVVVTYPVLGKSWNPAGSMTGFNAPPFQDFRIAIANLFPSTTVPNGEVLTVIWTITFNNV